MSVTPPQGAGQDVLVVDADRSVLRGLERLLGPAGLTVTAVSDPATARDQIINRFFLAVVCDLDTPGAGLDLLTFVRQRSPMTAVVVMTASDRFDRVAPVFRAGAADVVPKTEDAVPYLRARVVALASEVRTEVGRQQLLEDAGEVHEEFLRKMMELARHVTDLEDKLHDREGSVSKTFTGLGIVNVLLVDDDRELAVVLGKALPADKAWRIRYAQSGGEALDSASQNPPHILVAKDTLPDLPGRMVVRSIKATVPDVVALLFRAPGEAGEVSMVDNSRLLTLIPSFSDPEQLVGPLYEVREALRKKAKERRYLQSFRKEHFEFLNKHQRLKQRLAESRGRG